MSDSETVWVLPYLHNGRRTCYHTDPDCYALNRDDTRREPITKPMDAVSPHRPLCQACSGECSQPEERAEPPKRIENRFENRQAVHDALRRASRPLSSREIRLEALLSEGTVRRTLEDLIGLGQIEQTEDPDDRRVTRYRLASVCPDPPQRQRAQLTPTIRGLATLFCGLVLLAGYAIATAPTGVGV